MWKNIGVCGEIRYHEGLAYVVIGVMTFRADSRITNLVDVDGTRLVQNTIPRVQSWCQNCGKIFERGIKIGSVARRKILSTDECGRRRDEYSAVEYECLGN